jgi:hypothetical protein
MQTRSMTKNRTNVSLEIKEIVSDYIKETSSEKRESTHFTPIFEVDIDFDGASEAWHQNKKKLHDCTYKYICVHCFANGRKCCRVPLPDSNYCKAHSK